MALTNQKKIVDVSTKGNVGNPIKPVINTGNGNMEGNVSPVQIYQDIANQMPNSNANTVPTSTPAPTTPANENSDIVKAYQESAQRLQTEKGALDPNDSNYRIEEDTYNSKIESTNELIKAYMQNSKDSLSAKANAELANQKAVNGTAAYLKALGLEGQGIAESTMADVNKNYANAIAGIEAQVNENNSNAQNSYLEALKQADSERQSRLDQKDLIEDQRAYEEKRENQSTYYEMLNTDYSSIFKTDDNGNLLSVDNDALEEYKNLAEQYHNDGKISDVQYDSAIKLYQNALKEEGERLEQAVSNGGIIASEAKEADFGNYIDTGKAGSKQSIYVNTIIQAAKEGKIPNGTIINFNYGMGVIHNFEYKNGVWYTAPRQPKTKTYSYKDIEKLIGKIDY